MSILGLIVTFAVVGFCLWLVLTYVPMPAPMKQVLVVLVVLILILYAASAFGLLSSTGLTRPIYLSR